jgi:membrane protein
VLDSFKISISWTELAKRTVREFIADGCLGIAAQLSYYFFLALFPALLFLLALASFFSLEPVANQVVRGMAPVVPPDVLAIIRTQIERISQSDDGGLLTVGIAGAIWSSSAALASLVDSLNKAYDIDEGRPWWKVRLMAIGLTLALAAMVIIAFALIMVGPGTAQQLAEQVGIGPAFKWTWAILRWPAAIALVCFAVGVVFYFGPDARQEWKWITPGAVTATLLWMLVSVGFKFYVKNFTDYNAVYGTIGGVMVLLLWFYVSGLAILIGAEMNAEIEHASPYGKDPGEKAPGQRQRLARKDIRSPGA